MPEAFIAPSTAKIPPIAAKRPSRTPSPAAATLEPTLVELAEVDEPSEEPSVEPFVEPDGGGVTVTVAVSVTVSPGFTTVVGETTVVGVATVVVAPGVAVTVVVTVVVTGGTVSGTSAVKVRRLL